MVVVGGELKLEGSVLGLGGTGIVQWGLLVLQRLLLRHLGVAAKAMIGEDGHELWRRRRLGLGDGTRADVVAGERGRDELGLHEELGRGRVLVDLLVLLGSEQRLLVRKVEHTRRSIVVGVDRDPVLAGWWRPRVNSWSWESRVVDLSGPPLLLQDICVVCRGRW